MDKSLFVAALGLAISATSASAEIACNREGDCWHARDHSWIKSEHGLVVHPDNWKWGEREQYRWREHEGRGYWRDGAWVEIR